MQVLCPFILDQFYWADRMFWLGVSPEPLQRNHLLPDEDDAVCVKEAANALTSAIDSAISSQIKANAYKISQKLSSEVTLPLEIIYSSVLTLSRNICKKFFYVLCKITFLFLNDCYKMFLDSFWLTRFYSYCYYWMVF